MSDLVERLREEADYTHKHFYRVASDEQREQCRALTLEAADRIAALEAALRMIKTDVEGRWQEGHYVYQYAIIAREALTPLETFVRQPIDCKHERATIKCPDCGIDLTGNREGVK